MVQEGHSITKKQPLGFYNLREEIANSIIHGIGAGLSIAGLTTLLLLAAMNGDKWRVIGFSIYGASLVILYLASTLYHSITHPRTKEIFRAIDHSAIYLAIAGTYTPFVLVNMRTTGGWTMFGVVWGLALIGILFKIFLLHRFETLSVILYIAMGWLCVFALEELLANLPVGGFAWLLSGGLVYSIGVIFYIWDRIPYNHAVWHIFVLVGSICHYIAILRYVLPT